MLTAREERALIRRVLSGERDAAEALVRAYQGPLYSYLLRMTGRPEVAEDVTQEAFVRALTHLGRYNEQYRFSTWLFTIAKRLHVNARARLAPVFDSGVVGSAPQTVSGWSEEQADAGDVVAGASGALKRALGKLSDEQREAIVLFYQLAWPVEQIGQYMDLPVGTVKSHLYRARARLRSALAEDASVVAWLAEVPA
jgi:RNA polymerase sigma-70 factor (ECF subfamily)